MASWDVVASREGSGSTVARWSRKRWIVVVAIALVGVLAGAYGIFALIAGGDAPPPVALASETPSPDSGTGGTGSADPASGWTIDPEGSFVGYRIREQLATLPAPSDAVGRTSAVSGTLRIDGLEISAVDVTADVTRLTSDESRRDDRIRSSGLETDAFPEASFTLTEPIAFDAEPADGQTVDVMATGDLTLHGVTRSVEIPIQARRSGDTIEVVGSLEITLADYDIVPPNFGGFVTVEDHGTLELQLTFVTA
jgi:polyisoprenoid-binding protein YceI